MANLDELRNALRSQPATFLRDCMIAILDDVRTIVARADQLASVSSESCQRIDNLATLSTDVCRRLVDTRGEQSLHRMALDAHGEQIDGLRKLVTSMIDERGARPLSVIAAESKVQRLERELAETAIVRDEAVEVCARLRRERQDAINLAESRRVQLSALTESAEVVEARTAAAIAAWLVDDVIAIDRDIRRIIADGILAGEWKP